MKMKFRSASFLVPLTGCASALALAAACATPSARAQAGFQGSYTVEPGGVAPSISAGNDVITLNDAQTIINWRPSDTSGTGAIDFLPNGNSVTFTNNVSGVSDFTVLNRILPVDVGGQPSGRAVAFNGTVRSLINGAPGGKVWFYAPGGIIAGATSSFNVGSLILTSSDIDTSGGLYADNGNRIRFSGVTNPASSVEVMPQARIEALTSGSYVALVAPRVVQGGTVAVNGTAAYVAAEAADIRINGGLFDISIGVGTSDANGVVHSGATERASTTAAPGAAQRVYMVAVPKNNALTMLLSGDIGYAAADSVAQEGSAVVLAAGHDVSGGIGYRNSTATGQSDISIGASTWQPETSAFATGAITLRADQGQAIAAGGDLNLTAGAGATGGRIELLTFGGSGSSAGNGRIDVAGSLRLNAGAVGDSDYMGPLPATGDAVGGQIIVTATGGSISAANLSAFASARGGVGSDRSGNATGGSISLSALTIAGPNGAEAGSLAFGGMTLEAAARTESSYYNMPMMGGAVTGGTIDIAATGGSFTADSLFLDVTARGGDASGTAGMGRGGAVALSASAANGLRGSFAINDCASFSACEIRANGYGGYGLNGAAGTGGTVIIHAADADFTALGAMNVYTDGVGGGTSYDDFLPGTGGNGTGGVVTIESRAGAAGTGQMRFGDLLLHATGASTENIDGPSYNAGDGGDGIGGAANIRVAGGRLTANSISASASGVGGAAEANCESCGGGGLTAFRSGSGLGGSAQLLMTGGSAAIGSLQLVAKGIGGAATSGYSTDIPSIAGQGTGGNALLDWRGGALTAGSLLIDASGNGGGGGRYAYDADGVSGGDGTGGTARLMMAAGGAGQIIVDNEIIVRAAGIGGDGADSQSFSQNFHLAGDGGLGRGGTASATLAGGALTAPSLLVSAEGAGGAGGENGGIGPGGAAGDGAGGAASLAYLSEGHAIGSLKVVADGKGGLTGSNRYVADYDANFNPIYAYGPAGGSAGGSGTGGNAGLLIDVDPNFANLIVSADGFGSAGGIGAVGGAGGIGAGGVATLHIDFGATSVSDSVRVSALGVGGIGGDGLGGSGGRGGNALGGSATLGLAGASTSLDAGDIAVTAEALGGAGGLSGLMQTPGVDGAAGGDATGGTALFAVSAGASALTGALLKISGDATGGAGSAGTAGSAGGAGGSGGSASAGSATLRIDGGRLRYAGPLSSPPAYSITAIGQGGAGAAGGNGVSGGLGGNGGAGAGGIAAFEANDGDFALGSLAIIADGVGGLGGFGGAGSSGASVGGLGGASSGGTAQLTNGGAGALTPGGLRQMAALSMMANGALGGRALFTDSSTAAGGGLNILGALNMHAAGAPAAGFTGIDFTALGNIVQVGGDADFFSEGPLRFTFSGGGGLAAAGALTGYSGARIVISHAARPTDGYSLSGGSVALTTPGDIDGLAGGALRTINDIALTANGISAQRLASGGVALLDAGAGDLIVNDIAAGGDITAFGRNISLSAGGGMKIASAIASGDVTLKAGVIFTLVDRISGGAVSIGSGDIVVGPSAQIAAAGLLRFSALSAQQPAVVGGADATGGYSLSQAELDRTSAADLAIEGAGDIVVRDLTVGTAILPGGSVFSIAAAGRIQVEGALRLTGRAGQGGASLSAGKAIDVIADSGYIDISDGNGARAGMLALSAPIIRAATLAAIADLGTTDSLVARELRLAKNDGLANEEGLLRAGTIVADFTDGLYIQNTGVSDRFADRRGFTADSLIIRTQGRPQIAINGRLALSNGLFATGADAISLTTIDGDYAAGSKINGCLIVSPGACVATTPSGVDNRDTFDGLLDPTVAVARIFPSMLVELRDIVTQGYPPLIDEPVTGAGNEDLWERRCGATDEPACDAQ